jgi:hypothetical protein
MQASTIGTPKSAASNNAPRVAPSASLRIMALIGLPITLLNSRAAIRFPFGTMGSFCGGGGAWQYVRFRTEQHRQAKRSSNRPGDLGATSSETNERFSQHGW